MTDEEVFWKTFKITSAIIAPPIAFIIVKLVRKSNREIKDMIAEHESEMRGMKQRNVDEEIDESIEVNELRIELNKRNKK